MDKRFENEVCTHEPTRMYDMISYSSWARSDESLKRDDEQDNNNCSRYNRVAECVRIEQFVNGPVRSGGDKLANKNALGEPGDRRTTANGVGVIGYRVIAFSRTFYDTRHSFNTSIINIYINITNQL